ncbi:protein JASON-like isoform X1 [Hibiscus syriacus]|uniref:protein JASON-like isoform X1 n=1 Tax=Hibiscus syriacus TaxID=106335 RepID=UPI001922F3EF|nr:protein JASON-like isoform X1 [Hibiscus syriacus]
MGCFFACLRVRDRGSRPHLVSPSSKPAEHSVSGNRLSSLFLDEDRGDYPSHDLRSQKNDKDLKDEAKCHSSLSNTSTDKFQLDKQHHQPPTPIKLSEVLVTRSDSPDNIPNSCISNAANIGSFSVDSTEGSETITVDKAVKIDIEPTSAHGRNKSVRFECESDASSSSKYGDQNTKQLELLASQSASKPSPNTTPLKLSDEMQTPGTAFPSNGKIRIRSEDVHSVLNPVENAVLLNAKKEETFSSKEIFEELKESPERPEEATPKVGVKQTSLMKEPEEEGSLSSWFKPKQYTIDDHIRNLQATSSKIPPSGKTLVDRPIIGMVAAHWNEDKSSRFSPKWWDGNGIPNSTNKYKEDQKVSWHATSFEERLEKALSDESLISQRNHVNRTPMAFDENDESDTALSQLRHSPHSKSVISF